MSRCTANTEIVIGKSNENQIKIPIKVYLASTEEDKTEFNLISPEGNRIEQKCFDSVSNKEYARADLHSGYEYEKGKFLKITSDELDSLSNGNKIELQEVGKL